MTKDRIDDQKRVTSQTLVDLGFISRLPGHYLKDAERYAKASGENSYTGIQSQQEVLVIVVSHHISRTHYLWTEVTAAGVALQCPRE